MQVRCPSLVGRRAELDLLTPLVGAARRGEGHAVLLVGEAGIGKSRMVREVVAVGRRAAVVTVTGRAVQGASPVPLRPLVEAVQSLTRSQPLPDREAFGPYAAALGRLAPEWAGTAAHQEATTGPVLAEGLLAAAAVGRTTGLRRRVPGRRAPGRRGAERRGAGAPGAGAGAPGAGVPGAGAGCRGAERRGPAERRGAERRGPGHRVPGCRVPGAGCRVPGAG